MTGRHRIGKQEFARKRRQRRRLRRGGLMLVSSVVVLGAIAAVIWGGWGNAAVPEASEPALMDSEAFTGGSRLVVDRIVHDEGEVPYEQAVQAEFRLKNIGDQPLVLEDLAVNTLEGC